MTTALTDLLLSRRGLTSASAESPGLSMAELVTLVRDVAGDPGLWQPRVRLPKDGQRWWTQLSTDHRADVWLLSWLPGQATTLHDHGPSAAAFTVVRGELHEVRLDASRRRTVQTRRPGSVTYLAPGLIHDVRGAGSQPAVSIHAYSPPLRQMTYYDVDRGGGVRIAHSVPTDVPESEAATA